MQHVERFGDEVNELGGVASYQAANGSRVIVYLGLIMNGNYVNISQSYGPITLNFYKSPSFKCSEIQFRKNKDITLEVSKLIFSGN